jgi:uncharacterized membrane protein
MTLLLISLLVLTASHLVPSAPPVKSRLIALMGRPWFYTVYSVVSVLALAAVVAAYRAADPALLWLPWPGARPVALLLMPVALFLVVCRLTTRPSAVRRGIYRITAAPGSLGVLIWTLVHLANVGAARTVVLFAAFAVIALAALIKNVGTAPKSASTEGSVWSEIGWVRPAGAILLYIALLHLHPLVIGVDPLAGLT